MVLLVGSLLFLPSAAPFPARSFEGAAQPYFFALARWEGANLAIKAGQKVKGLFRPPPAPLPTYFQGGPRPGAEAVVEGEIARVLREEGISPFPPVAFRFDAPPNLLIISPRERIELKKTILLRPQLTLGEIESLEGEAEALGVSALVEGVGGVATYPSLLPPTGDLERAVGIVAHEWLHHYFAFRPLGWNYNKSYEMTILNESAAGLAGRELSRRVLLRYGLELRESRAEPSPFNREMRGIRQEVDRLLAQGQAEEAERFMEVSRQRLAGMGYSIRRLNQAYFAFHGSYAEDPASVSPIGEELRQLWEKAGSLGEFLRRVSRIGRYEELKRLLTAPQS